MTGIARRDSFFYYEVVEIQTSLECKECHKLHGTPEHVNELRGVIVDIDRTRSNEHIYGVRVFQQKAVMYFHVHELVSVADIVLDKLRRSAMR